jgi:hypothetical protein
MYCSLSSDKTNRGLQKVLVLPISLYQTTRFRNPVGLDSEPNSQNNRIVFATKKSLKKPSQTIPETILLRQKGQGTLLLLIRSNTRRGIDPVSLQLPAKAAWSDSYSRVAPYSLDLPGLSTSSDEKAALIHHKPDRGPDRVAIPPVTLDTDAVLSGKLLQFEVCSVVR